MMKVQSTEGFFSLFRFRGFNQNSLQSTVEAHPRERPLIIPRTGTSAPLGVPTMHKQTMTTERKK